MANKRNGYILFITLIIAAIICAMAFSGIIATEKASADTSGLSADEITGIKLNGYNVNLTYKYYVLDYSGLELSIGVVFDREYVTANYGGEGQETIQGVLTELSLLIKNMGYTISIDTANNAMTGTMSFDTLTDYDIATGSDSYEVYSGNPDKKTTFYYVESTTTTKTVFNGIEESEGLLQNFLQNFYNLGITRDKILLSYEYGTPYKIITSDADNVTFSVGKKIYVHEFNMNLDNSSREIHFYQKSPNAVGWYLTALFVALLITGAIVAVYFVNKKKHRRN